MARDDLTFESHSPDDDREVQLEPEEPPILPDRTVDETSTGWNDDRDSNDARLLEDRPPHW